MKHKWLPLILCAILLLPSCGTSEPAIVPEAQLQNDLRSNAAFKEAVEEASLEITDFKIIKRQTTPEEKTDKVWVAVDAQTNNDSSDRLFTVGAHLECVMVYGLYNDGWILDEIVTEDDAWSFVPLSGFSDEAAAEIIQIEGGEFISNVVDLDKGVQYTTFRQTFAEQYCESVYVTEREWIFSGGSWNVTFNNTLDTNEAWHIGGKFFFPDYRADLWLKFDGSTFQWDDGSADLANGLVRTNNLPLKQYALSYLPCYYVNEVQNGYSIEFDGVDWSDIRYATTRWPIFLIGKNHIYRWSLGQEIDHGTKTVHYYGFEELIPDNRSNSSYSSGAKAAYIPGTYTGTGSGWDSITVSVTVDEYSITGINVIEDNETVGVGSPRPLNQMIESILKKNSTDVDTVSGATITSNGVIAAVKDALAKAQKP